MIDAIAHVNWLAVFVASIAHFVFGAAWFVGIVGNRYADALGIADRPPAKPGALFFVGPFACSAVTVVASAILLRALGITSYGGALGLGALVSLGYLVPMTVNIAINPLFPRPFYYALLNAPFFVGGSLMACAIIVALS